MATFKNSQKAEDLHSIRLVNFIEVLQLHVVACRPVAK
jgi:hypothetical protein